MLLKIKSKRKNKSLIKTRADFYRLREYMFTIHNYNYYMIKNQRKYENGNINKFYYVYRVEVKKDNTPSLNKYDIKRCVHGEFIDIIIKNHKNIVYK